MALTAKNGFSRGHRHSSIIISHYVRKGVMELETNKGLELANGRPMRQSWLNEEADQGSHLDPLLEEFEISKGFMALQ